MRVRFQSIIVSMNALLTVVATTEWRPSVIFLVLSRPGLKQGAAHTETLVRKQILLLGQADNSSKIRFALFGYISSTFFRIIVRLFDNPAKSSLA